MIPTTGGYSGRVQKDTKLSGPHNIKCGTSGLAAQVIVRPLKR
jgi:hypothetical protein